jgi:hypothetical protein
VVGVSDADRTLIEATRTHRARMVSALTFGTDGRSRAVNNNSKRVIGSVVLAAVVCVGCLGFAFVVNLLDNRKESQAQQAFSQAQAGNPLRPTPPATNDPVTGFIVDEAGRMTDPRTGWSIDPVTGMAQSPDGRLMDTRNGWYVTCPKIADRDVKAALRNGTVDLDDCWRTDPSSGLTVDPTTGKVVEK